MAKVIKGEKKLAIIVSQKEYDLIAALVGMTNQGTEGQYDWELWKVLRGYQAYKNVNRQLAEISKSRASINVLNREQEEY